MALTSKLDGMSIEFGGYHNDNAKADLLADILSYAGKVTGNENFVKK